MSAMPEGNAIVFCEGAFETPNGKTAHGLVRFTRRYRLLSVIDSHCAGTDAAAILDGAPKSIPLVANLEDALGNARDRGLQPSHLVIGLAPDGGRLPPAARQDIMKAIKAGLNIDSGLHDFLSEDRELAALAAAKGVVIRDVRKPPPRNQLHFFSGKIEEVDALKIALLGTDSAIGKRTTAWLLVHGLEAAGVRAQMIGTGQTAWMQGARYTIVLDSLINDFVSGEIEHVVWSAWQETKAQALVIEGQGSLMNPAYPGGFEILAAGRPNLVVLQHAPARKDYDGFPGYPLHPLHRQIEAIELLSSRPVVAVTINHEGLVREEIPAICAFIEKETGRPAYDVLLNGTAGLVETITKEWRKGRKNA